MRRCIFFIILVVAIALFAACSGKDSSKKVLNGKLTIVYTGNVGGKTDPCGCRIPMGGLAKRATVINTIKTESENVLVFDSGALLYPSNYMYPPYDYTMRVQGHLINDIVNEIGIHAMNVASYDLANSPDSLLAMAASSKGKWLSANIVWKETNELVFTPDALFTSGEFRVGVFGFMAQKSVGVDIFKKDAPITVLDPVEAAKKEVRKLEGDCDIIVALAYMDFDKAKELAAEVPGINVMVVSHTRQHRPSSEHHFFLPDQVNDTILVRCPDGGRVVGRLDLFMADGSVQFTPFSQFGDLRPAAVQEQNKLPESSKYQNYFYNLDPSVKRVRELQDKIDIVENWAQAYKDSLNVK